MRSVKEKTHDSVMALREVVNEGWVEGGDWGGSVAASFPVLENMRFPTPGLHLKCKDAGRGDGGG